ncbi:MAG: hypothetical protein ASARMPREDX12_003259 [Alectoria sarmentosa]|nr:MAG: hypothetical protein ASARMPREDX12_003259 [Alectoria sarmentosa]
MSLNGLEATEVNDAYQAALAEGGGWFLLNYISRDEVSLLEKGNGGLAELQEVVNRYEQQSPLYGFIQYRRRKVILKYIPEGTSRLLQARVTVQFQSVIEKLSPNDTIFHFAQSAELRDSTLSSACSLHTATASIKSSNDSLPPRGLAEITEDASESRVDTVGGGVVHGGTARDEAKFSGVEDAQSRPENVDGFPSADLTHHRSTSGTTQSSFRPRTTSNTDKPLPPPPPDDHAREGTSTGSVLDPGEYSTRPSTDGRFSSNSTRPSTRDLYDAYGYKKKAKMGPRPSTDSVGAPNNLDSQANEFRPVSTLPAGLRMPSRKAIPTRPASRQAQAVSPTQISSPVQSSPPAKNISPDKVTPKKAPTAPVAPIHIPDRHFSMPHNGLRTPTMSEPGSPKMTPEKQRLMKALQLRQKQIAARNSVNGFGSKSVVEEPEFAKPEIDDSILSAVMGASNSAEGPEPVQIATKEFTKEESRHLEDSPISMPETAEESSTQASSITDEEEVVAQKRQGNHSNSIPAISEHQDLQFNNLAEDPHSQLIRTQEVVPEVSEKDTLTKAALTESVKDPSQPSTSTQSHFFVADKNVAEQKAREKEFPEVGQHDSSPMMDGHLNAKEIDWEKQLSSSQISAGQSPEDQTTAVSTPPLFDQKTSSPAEIDENRQVQQSESLEDHDNKACTGDVSSEKDLLQIHTTVENETVHSTAKTDDHARILQSQSEESHRQSLGRPVRSSDESVSRVAQTDTVEPLLVRWSSSSKSITVPSDNDVNAHEVPLPPVDEDEEISLSPQPALLRDQAATHTRLNTDTESKAATLETELPSQDNDYSDTQPTTSNGLGERQAERQSLRQEVINPIKRVSSTDQSEEHFLSDDSFMEELKSATMQEAKPVSVSKSPIKPVFSRSESEQRLNGSTRGSRSVSTPVDHSTNDEEVFTSPRLPTPLSTSRSISAQHAPRPNSQQSQVPISKKIGVSSSISQRIKALEQLSSRPTSPLLPNLAPNTSTFLFLRKTSPRTPPGVSDYKNSNFNKSRPGTAYPSPSPSPEVVKSNKFDHLNKADYLHPIRSITATLVREARDKSPEIPSNQSEPRHMDPQESPHQWKRQKSPPPAEHNLMGPPPLSPLKPPRPRFGRYSSTRSRSSSSNEQKIEPPQTTRRDSFASIRSKSSRAGSEVELPRTLSDSSLSGVVSLDGTQDEKKDSRRSRLLKRMSSISSMSRRSIAHALSPGPKEAPIIERQEPVQEARSTSVDVGDVNVQFPDNLLWKRRHMAIDTEGILVLSASKTDNNSKVITKRYPLSDFRSPYIPDQDRQELPNSVILDFKDGSTLQCACEHLQGQAGVLKALRHAHSTHQLQ